MPSLNQDGQIIDTFPAFLPEYDNYFNQYQVLVKRIRYNPKLPLDNYEVAIRLAARLAKFDMRVGRSIDEYRSGVRWIGNKMVKAGFGAQAEFQEGYFHYYIQEFDTAIELFQKAETKNQMDWWYWMDRGRAEYNTGRLHEALRSFQLGYQRAERTGNLEAQHARWLAKTCRWLGEPRLEAEHLLSVLKFAEGKVLEGQSFTLVTERLPRALLLSGQPERALAFIDSWFGRAPGHQAQLAAARTEALVALDRGDEALQYALKAVKTIEGGELALAAAYAGLNQPFSAYNAMLAALKSTAGTLGTMTDEDPETGEPRGLIEPVNPEFTRVYGASCRAVQLGQADLAVDLLIEAAVLALQEPGGMALIYCLNAIHEQNIDHPRLMHLHAESLQRFPEDPRLLLYAAQFHFSRGRYEQALELFRRTAASSSAYAVVANPRIAETLGELNEHEAALTQFRKSLGCPRSNLNADSVAETYYMPAMRWAERSGHHLQALSWTEAWLQYTNGVVTFKKSIPIFLAAGRCALSLGRPADAYAHFKRAAAAYAARLIDTEAAELSLRDMARTSAMVALAALLSGETQDVESWLATARSQAGDLDIIALVSALSLAYSGDAAAAHELLIYTERTPLWGAVARLVAQSCEAQGQEALADDLNRKATVAEGRAPSVEEVLAQLSDRDARLLAARQEATNHTLFRENMQGTFEALIVRTGLLPEDHTAYLSMKAALDSGEVFDPEEIIQSVLKHQADQVRRSTIIGEVCRQRLGEAWAQLDPAVQELLSLTENHEAYVRAQALKDYGPAMMYLAKLIEDLLYEDVARVLEREMAALGSDVPWDSFSIGCVPLRLIGKSSPASLEYNRAFQQLESRLPDRAKQYVRGAWRKEAKDLADVRNDWAHSNAMVGEAAFQRLLEEVVGPPGSATVLGASLALAAAVREMFEA